MVFELLCFLFLGWVCVDMESGVVDGGFRCVNVSSRGQVHKGIRLWCMASRSGCSNSSLAFFFCLSRRALGGVLEGWLSGYLGVHGLCLGVFLRVVFGVVWVIFWGLPVRLSPRPCCVLEVCLGLFSRVVFGVVRVFLRVVRVCF